MKSINTLILAAALLSCSSCVTYYTVVPQLHPDGSLTETYYTDADSACLAGDLSSQPFFFKLGEDWQTGPMDKPTVQWFIGDSAVMDFYATRHMAKGDTATRLTPASEDYAGLPYLDSRQEWNRDWGLFYHTYTYTCRFPSTRDRMPAPLEDHMTPEEIRAWLTDAGNLHGMSGFEVYDMTSSLMDKFTEWENHCYYEEIYRLITQSCGDTLTAAQKKELFGQMRGKFTYSIDGLSSTRKASIATMAKAMTDISGNPAFSQAIETHLDQWNTDIEKTEESLLMPMTLVLMYKVEMPGRLISANTDLKDNDIPVWKVDGLRLLDSDVVIEATSRKANPLGFILTGFVALFFLRLVFRPRPR